MSFDAANPIASIFAEIIGRRAWLVRKGHGSFLTFEFGEPHLKVRTAIPEAKTKGLRRPMVTVSGDWHLWIYCCDWQIVESGLVVAHSESDDAEIAKAAQALDGQMLVDVVVDPVTGGSRFVFELGTMLETTRFEDDIDENWLLYAPDGYVLTYRADGRYVWQPSSTKPDDEVWLPVPPKA